MSYQFMLKEIDIRYILVNFLKLLILKQKFGLKIIQIRPLFFSICQMTQIWNGVPRCYLASTWILHGPPRMLSYINNASLLSAARSKVFWQRWRTGWGGSFVKRQWENWSSNRLLYSQRRSFHFFKNGESSSCNSLSTMINHCGGDEVRSLSISSSAPPPTSVSLSDANR